MCLKRIKTLINDTQVNKEGEGTMSAATQNFVYVYGKKQEGKKDPVMSAERLKEIKASVAKYLADKKR